LTSASFLAKLSIKLIGGSVEVQLSNIHAPEPSLFQDSSTQNQSANSFQKYLEDEQKRLALLFSPWSQFNFDSLFAYPSSRANPETSGTNNFIFDIEITPPEYQASNPAKSENALPLAAAQSYSETGGSYFPKPPQLILQELLAKNGWLAPNLEASPLFFQAQLEGKLLSKLDLQFLVDQILTQVKLIKGKGKTELMLGLKPENLGEILLTLTSKSGMISIQIQAPEETRKLLEELRQELELALKKSNVNLAEIKIQELKEVKEHA
jgi:hypothetical protein